MHAGSRGRPLPRGPCNAEEDSGRRKRMRGGAHPPLTATHMPARHARGEEGTIGDPNRLPTTPGHPPSQRNGSACCHELVPRRRGRPVTFAVTKRSRLAMEGPPQLRLLLRRASRSLPHVRLTLRRTKATVAGMRRRETRRLRRRNPPGGWDRLLGSAAPLGLLTSA